MAATFKFELVTPERVLMSEDALQVVLPGGEGDFAVLPGHAPFISTLRPGVLDITLGAAQRKIFVKSGFAEVSPDRLTVLAQHATPVEEMTAARLAGDLAAAESALAATKGDEERRIAYALVDGLKRLQAA